MDRLRICNHAPRRFIGKLRSENELFNNHQHQDAHEFLNYLLNEAAELLEKLQALSGLELVAETLADHYPVVRNAFLSEAAAPFDAIVDDDAGLAQQRLFDEYPSLTIDPLNDGGMLPLSMLPPDERRVVVEYVALVRELGGAELHRDELARQDLDGAVVVPPHVL